MHRCIFLALLFISCIARAQTLSPSAASELLPAFRNDDSTLFKSQITPHAAEGTVLLQLACVTNAPRIFRYVLDHYHNIDPDLAILLALHYASRPILEAALQKPLSLGEYPVNTVLASAWTKNEDEPIPSERVMELLVYASLPETSIDDYLPLLLRVPDAATRAAVAAWLIGRQQAFDYYELSRLGSLEPAYQPVVELLVQRLRNLPAGEPIRGFGSRHQALLYAAVQSNDLKELKSLAEDAETLEFTVPGNHSLFSFAIEHAGLPVIKFLLSRDIDPDYYHAQSRRSVLGALLARGDQAILQAVMPYIKSTTIELEQGNTPVFYCVQSFFKLVPAAENASQRQFYLSALKLLRYSGADFNQFSGQFQLPIHLLPKTLGDSLARSAAILVLEQTSDDLGLAAYASQFTYATPADLPVLKVLCQHMKDPGKLFYNSDLQKAGLFPLILQEARHLPALKTYSVLLRSATYYKNVQQVRWLLNDVPMAYMKRDPSMNPDSIRRVIVNTPLAGDGENILYYFLSQEHTVDWASKSVMKALMAAGSDLYQWQTLDRKRPIDLLLASAYYQKQYANEILSGLLPDVQLQCDDPGAWQQTSTGDLYRKSLIAYQQDKNWLQQLKNCISMDLNGSAVTGKPNRRVNITGVGRVALGSFPLKSCEAVEAYKIAGNPQRYVFNFSSGAGIGPYPVFSVNEQRKEAASLRATFDVKGHSGVENMTMSVTSTINIPGSVLDTGNHSIPPMILIRNNGDQVIVQQQNVPSYLAKGMEEIFDRSKGPIQVMYQRNHDEIELRLEIYGRLHDTEYPDLVVPIDTDPVSRLRLYAEIVRLRNQVRNNPGKTTADQIYRKQDEVLIHLLSEYALQRYYPKKVKEEYDQNLRQLADINRLMEPLGQFYQQYAVLDFNNVAQLKKTLQALIGESTLNEQQRRNYTALLQRLDEATQLSQLADTYGQLMNSELLQQAEKQLDDKRRIGLEAALYATGGHLTLDNKQ